MTQEEFWSTVTPALLSFLSVAVPAILSYIAYIVQSWVAKAREGKDREALHSALETGAKASQVNLLADTHVDERTAYVVDYARKSVPDAIRNLNPTNEVLTQLAESKLEKEPCP